jgi:hypothetical protein
MTTKERLEELFGVELQVDLDSAQDGCTDEEFGNFFQCSIAPNPIPHLEDYPLIVVIYYEQDLVQFFHDATPYPVAANTQREEREMFQFLNPCPVRPDQVTKQDFENFVQRVKEHNPEDEE